MQSALFIAGLGVDLLSQGRADWHFRNVKEKTNVQLDAAGEARHRHS